MQKNRYLIALVAALGLIPVVLDTTIVTVALVPIRADLNTDLNTAQWIVTGFFLANAAVVAIGGYLSSRFGRKRVFIVGLTVFTSGSLLCALSPGIGWLIGFRVLQGIGGGLLLPIGPALAFDAFPQAERAKASALVALPILLAPVFGPIAGGYLNDTFNWHSLFLINLPVGVVAALAALVVLPRDDTTTRGVGFDYIGMALSTISVIAIVYGFKLVTTTNPASVTTANPAGDLYGWTAWQVWAWIGGGALALVIFAVYALFISRDPALDLRQLGRRDFLVSNIFIWLTSLITFGLLVLLPLYFESVRVPHLSPLDTGIALVPFGAGTFVGTIIAAALYRAIGARWVAVLSAVVSAVAAWQLAQVVHPTADASKLVAALQTGTAVPAVAGPEDIRWLLFLAGLGFVMSAIATQTLALEALSGEALSKASSLLLSTKLIFSSVGVAILTTLFVNDTRSRATDLAAQLQTMNQGAGTAPGNPAALQALMAQIPVQASTWAIQNIFWLICFGSLPLILLALLLPGRQRTGKVAASEAGMRQQFVQNWDLVQIR